MEFVCSSCVCPSILQVLQFPPEDQNMFVRLNGDSKLPLDTSMLVHDYLSIH